MQWEVAWDSVQQRWYYQDRFSLKSSWERPLGCTLELPDKPPQGRRASTNLPIPQSWQVCYDVRANRWFYCNLLSGERSWKHPSKRRASYDRGRARSLSAPRMETVEEEICSWDAVAIAAELAAARRSGDTNRVKVMLKRVAQHNHSITTRVQVQRTALVPSEMCREKAKRLAPKKSDVPVVSLSSMTTADALMHFAEPTGKKVCGLNFANGKTVGSGYKIGSSAQEEDLCRRIPGLYESLLVAEEVGTYPFGPATAESPSKPCRYCHVLWTGNISIARSSEDQGFALLPCPEQLRVSIVSAVAPNLRSSPPDTWSDELVYDTIRNIFVAPRMLQPETSILVLGAWGCGESGCKPDVMAKLFARALVDDELGGLYQKVHFAIPTLDTTGKQSHAVFKEALSRMGVVVRDLAADEDEDGAEIAKDQTTVSFL